MKTEKSYRLRLQKRNEYSVFPITDPSYYQVIGLLLSIGYLFSHDLIIQSVLVGVILALDWIGSLVVYRDDILRREKWMIEMFVDRLSEGFIFAAHLFTPLGILFFILYLFNILLSIYAVKSLKSVVIPLRSIWLLILVGKLLKF